MLADEARLMAMMQHPNIVYVQWFGQLDHPDDGRVFAMLMEFVQGRTLASLLEEARRDSRPLPLGVLLDVYLDVARALAFAHSLKDSFGVPLGLVHRDLKPDNVMVSAQGVVKLLDFGIAKATGRLAQKTATDMVRGTVQYMSPEQVKGLKDLDFRSDLFSFGAMLYEAVTGARLINAQTVIAALHQVASFQSDEAIATITRNAPGLAPVLEQLLDPDRSRRFASTDQLVQALEQVRRGVDSPVSTSTFLRERVSPLGDTASVPTPADVGAASGTEDTVAIDTGEQSAGSAAASGSSPSPTSSPSPSSSSASPATPPPTQVSARHGAPGPAASPPAAPDDTLPLSGGTPAHTGGHEAPRRSWIPWVAAPLILILGVVLGYVALRVLERQPPEQASISAAEAPPPTDEDDAVAGLDLAEEGDSLDLEDDFEAEAEPARERSQVARPGDLAMRGAAPDPAADAARRRELLGPAKQRAGSRPAAQARTEAPATKPPPEPGPMAKPTVDAEPGRLRLSADHPFELSIRNTRYTAREARRGIELPPGTHKATVVCLQCPEGVQTSMTVSIELRSGATATRVLNFPAAK